MVANYDKEWADEEPLGFATTLSSSDGVVYPTDQAEERDLQHLIENSCMQCTRILRRYDVRVVPSSYVQERDPYVRKGTVSRRIMCVNCYNSMKVVHRSRMQRQVRQERSPLVRQAIHSFLTMRPKAQVQR